jgi:hypothetical protein
MGPGFGKNIGDAFTGLLRLVALLGGTVLVLIGVIIYLLVR